MRSAFWGILVFGGAFLLCFIAYDILFSEPQTLEGTVSELIYVPGKTVATYTPYVGRKIGDHTVVGARDPQWIAVVTRDREDYQVHCTAEHYKQLAVGDTLKFKQYEGEVFHIHYFAHSEDH